jgi:2-polyprenyl-3-methyl-5-hydroxy-6-metoxy-1,4-benzoquinol methylase
VGGHLSRVAERWLKWRTLRRWLADPEVRRRVDRVLDFDPTREGQSVTVGDPRSVPGYPEFRRSGWTDHMLLRYLLALGYARDREVLDSCCGLGWGSFLVGSHAARVVGIDLDQASIEICRRQWQDPRTEYVTGSVLDLPFADRSFDVVLCMEAIEHFSVPDGERYLAELGRVCRPGGWLVGSSAFPETRAAADRLRAQNPHHLHVYSRHEMAALLGKRFQRTALLTPHYFAARLP